MHTRVHQVQYSVLSVEQLWREACICLLHTAAAGHWWPALPGTGEQVATSPHQLLPLTFCILALLADFPLWREFGGRTFIP